MPVPVARRTALALMLGLSALAGCGDEDRGMTRRVVDIATVPPAILEAARKQLPGVEFKDAWTNHEAGKAAIHSYEIKGRNTQTGKIREVRVGLDGKILEEE